MLEILKKSEPLPEKCGPLLKKYPPQRRVRVNKGPSDFLVNVMENLLIIQQKL